MPDELPCPECERTDDCECAPGILTKSERLRVWAEPSIFIEDYSTVEEDYS